MDKTENEIWIYFNKSWGLEYLQLGHSFNEIPGFDNAISYCYDDKHPMYMIHHGNEAINKLTGKPIKSLAEAKSLTAENIIKKSSEELIAEDKYYNRPPEELVLLSISEHNELHNYLNELFADKRPIIVNGKFVFPAIGTSRKMLEHYPELKNLDKSSKEYKHKMDAECRFVNKYGYNSWDIHNPIAHKLKRNLIRRTLTAAKLKKISDITKSTNWKPPVIKTIKRNTPLSGKYTGCKIHYVEIKKADKQCH